MATPKDIENRWPITIAMMLATVMNSLDTTIANVALPHIQGSISASPDQITWVLTSYLIASAVMTPLSGWLSRRIGRKELLLISIGGFTAASMLCGIANSLGEIVVFRLLQGLFGASLIPMSQAIVLDLFPPSQVGQVMALWGAAVILGPIFGPVLGGWLTDNFSWRWVFYINLPIGFLAFLGLVLFMQSDRGGQAKRLDLIGFASLTVAVSSFQVMIDRGPTLDWFSSTEIWTEAIIALIAFWIFVVQTATGRDPFFPRVLVFDRNFVFCTIFGFFIGIFLFSTMALLPPMMQNLMGYSTFESGLLSMPRGLGSFAAMIVVGRLIGRVDTRIILFVGLSLCTIALWQMSNFDLSMGETPFIVSGIVQGLGTGLIFVPLSALAFATLEPRYRPDATGLYNLIRNLGSSVGISLMEALWTSNTQTVHASLADRLSASNPVTRAALPPPFSFSGPGLEALNGEVTRQAAMVAYVDDFRLMTFITVGVMPLLLFMRTPRHAGGRADPAAAH